MASGTGLGGDDTAAHKLVDKKTLALDAFRTLVLLHHEIMAGSVWI